MNSPRWIPALEQTRLAILPPAPPLDSPDLPDRVRGLLLGIAIGDALGNRTEGLDPAEREAQHGRITGYAPSRYANGAIAGTPSDDTQLTARTLEQLVDDGALIADELAFRIANDRLFGVDRATLDFCKALRTGAPWWECTQHSAGNGAMVRIAPLILPHAVNGGVGLWSEVALATAVTHNDPMAIAANVAWVAFLWRLLNADLPESPAEWLETYTEVLRVLDHGQTYESRVTSGPLQHWRGSLSQLLDAEVRPAVQRATPIRDAAQRWQSGAFLLETAPTVLHIIAQLGDSPRDAMLAAVNDTRDNDTIAALVGAAMGAAHGTSWIPTEWREPLLGRTHEDDDGYYFALIDRAVARFVL
ncbi:MAG: ADP-ribosylglycohydrolase family protein [Gemmatimonadaceae bacterium]|nr:ADP-ribosylglycohydrolase family protein [Gemmatimonadaceae bacterium]